MNNSGNNYDYLFIEPKYLKADPSYQRELNHARVNEIVKKFNPNLFNEPKVSKRNDGYYYVFDGDHSIAVHQIVYGKDCPIKCKVYYGLSPEEEMQLFVQQRGISKNPTNIEKLRARANYSDPDVKEMLESANTAGVTIEFKALPGENKILAVDTAFRVFKNIGRTNFINMLTVIKKAWNGSPESYAQGMLKGFGYIYKHCQEQLRYVSNIEFARSMQGYPVNKITERATVLTGTMDRRFAQAIIEQYNKHKRSKRLTLPEK